MQGSAENFAAARKAGSEAQTQLLFDRAEISDVILRYGQSIDTRDFDLFRTCYTDEIEMHFGGTVSGGKTHFKVDEWVHMAKSFHTQLDATQHLIVPMGINISGDTATCYALIQAGHIKRDTSGSPFQHIYGYYLYTLKRTADGWKICKGEQTVKWGEGNWQIHSDAAKVWDKK